MLDLANKHIPWLSQLGCWLPVYGTHVLHAPYYVD